MTHLLCINIRTDQMDFLRKALKIEKESSMSSLFRKLIDKYSNDLFALLNFFEVGLKEVL